jgi:uncharacterized protein
MTTFTPVASLFGGALIGLAAVMLLATTGRIAGISGIVSRLFPPYSDDALPMRLAFVAGLVVAPALMWSLFKIPTGAVISGNVPLIATAGLIVGFGSAYGSGCTSGHGVCGLAQLSVRSLAATVTFMLTAGVTVYVIRHVLGG